MRWSSPSKQIGYKALIDQEGEGARADEANGIPFMPPVDTLVLAKTSDHPIPKAGLDQFRLELLKGRHLSRDRLHGWLRDDFQRHLIAVVGKPKPRGQHRVEH